MAVKAMRVSKTSFKPWNLYGPIESALATSCQADQVKAIPLHVKDVHGESVDLELWINTEPLTDPDDEPNPAAQQILAVQELQNKGLSLTEVEAFGTDGLFDDIPAVLGVAVLTGQGAQSFPDEHPMCVVAALLGNHSEPSFDDGSLN